MNPALLVLGGLLGFALLSKLVRPAARTFSKIFEPTIETRLHVVNAQGIVEASPQGLAIAAGVPLEQYVLASAMQSEEKTNKGRLAVGCAIWNMVKHNRSKIVRLLIPHGYLGSQTVNPYASTSQPPTAKTLGLAGAILENRVVDFVEGAVQWDAPQQQDRNYQLFLSDPIKYKKFKHDSKAIAQRRVARGAREVNVPGVTETRFWSYT